MFHDDGYVWMKRKKVSGKSKLSSLHLCAATGFASLLDFRPYPHQRKTMEVVVKQSEKKRAQILQAASVEFKENGFAATNMDKISARAEVSKRTVYKHFSSKEVLFRTLLYDLWDQFAEGVEVTYQKGVPIRAQLMDLGAAEGRLLTSESIMSTTRMVMTEVLRSPELVDENQKKLDFVSAFETVMRDAAEDGQLVIENPRQAAEEFLALIKAKAFWPVVYGAPIVGAAEMDTIVQASVDMIMCRYQP